MVTNQIMTRDLKGIQVLQRTKDEMFDATSFLKQYNKLNGIRRGKEVNDFLKIDRTKEFINALEIEENITTKKIVAVQNGGLAKGTWMHPYLFIDYAMWVNPTFKVQVIKFVYDELIQNRHNAGDNYKTLSASGTKLKGYDFVEIAKAMQWIIFGSTGKNLRNQATQEQLKELSELQTKLAFAIDMGFITTYKQLLSEMRKIYNIKYKRF